jgi:hypothetical protein
MVFLSEMDADVIRDPAVKTVLVHGPLGCGKSSACEAAFAAAGAEVIRPPASGVKRAWLELVVSGGRVTDVMRVTDGDQRPIVMFLDDLWTLCGANATLEISDVLTVLAAVRAPFKVVMTCSSKHALRFGEIRAKCDVCIEHRRRDDDPEDDPYVDARVVDVVAALIARRPPLRELMRVVAEEPRMIMHTMLENSRPTTLDEQARLMRAFLSTAELEGHCFQNADSPVADVPYTYRTHAVLRLTSQPQNNGFAHGTPCDEAGERAPAKSRAAGGARFLKHSQAHNRIAQHVLIRARSAQLYSTKLLGLPNIMAWAGRVNERLPSGTSCYAAALARQLRALVQKKL